MDSAQIIADAYGEYAPRVQNYILSKIRCAEDARDLTQDVFLRIVEHSRWIAPATLRSLIYTVARNVLNDYLRRHYVREQADLYMRDYATVSTDETESRIVADDLYAAELRRVASMPRQRGTVYAMKRYDGKTAAEIALELGLSRRTVENHIFAGTKEVRAYMRAIS